MLAILTNNFVPCNGRFPTLIAILTMFFVGVAGGAFSSILSALLLTGVILLGIFVTFGVTKLLSTTLLKGEPSSFTLELPPYRRPQVGKVIVRSVFDRALFVLGQSRRRRRARGDCDLADGERHCGRRQRARPLRCVSGPLCKANGFGWRHTHRIYSGFSGK